MNKILKLNGFYISFIEINFLNHIISIEFFFEILNSLCNLNLKYDNGCHSNSAHKNTLFISVLFHVILYVGN